MDSNKYIVGVGEILWDVFPQGKALGGAPANFAYHVSQFGLNGLVVSAIGRDELGEEIKTLLENKPMGTYLQEVDTPTGTVKVSLNQNGIPEYEICENVAWDNIEFTDKLQELASKVKTICFGSLAQRNELSRSTINKFLDAMDIDALKVFDINLRQHFYTKEVLELSLTKCNILKINDEEVEIIRNFFGWDNLNEKEVCLKLLKEYGLMIIVLTRGTEGSYVMTENEEFFKPTPIVKVADTVGAGDSFTATFVAGLLYGKKIEEAHELAVEVSAFVCTQTGAMPTIPDNLKIKMTGN